MSLGDVVRRILLGQTPEEFERKEVRNRQIGQRLRELRTRDGQGPYFLGSHRNDAFYVHPEGRVIVNLRRAFEKDASADQDTPDRVY